MDIDRILAWLSVYVIIIAGICVNIVPIILLKIFSFWILLMYLFIIPVDIGLIICIIMLLEGHK